MTYIINFRMQAGSEYKTRRANYKDTIEFCVQVTREGGSFVVVPPADGGIPITATDVAAYIQEAQSGEHG